MKVLVVDDDSASRFLLEDLVSEWGYESIPVSDGEEAWKILKEKDSPQIVLSDWMMPGMDGVELCKKVKERHNYPYTYFILLTSKSEKSDLIAGLDAGADDFLSKPIVQTELRSRLAVGLRTVNFDKEIQRYATQMESLAEERALQLVHAERLAMLGTLSAGIAHEINNSLTIVYGAIGLLEHYWNDVDNFLQKPAKRGGDDASKAKFLLEKFPKLIARLTEGSERLEGIANGFKRFSRKDQGEFIDCSVNECIKQALLISSNRFKYKVKSRQSLCENLPIIKAVPQRLEQVLANLFLNAADAMEPEGGELHIKTELLKDQVQIIVEDTGPGIPEDKLETIWEAFFTTKEESKGTGLGLSISKGIIEEHKGTIVAQNIDKGGARFVINLPVNE